MKDLPDCAMNEVLLLVKAYIILASKSAARTGKGDQTLAESRELASR
jgi:hypothetical protein